MADTKPLRNRPLGLPALPPHPDFRPFFRTQPASPHDGILPSRCVDRLSTPRVLVPGSTVLGFCSDIGTADLPDRTLRTLGPDLWTLGPLDPGTFLTAPEHIPGE